MTIKEIWKRIGLLERSLNELRQMFQNFPIRAGASVLNSFAGCGKLDESLGPGGNADASVYKPSSTGGIGTDTNTTVTVIDIGMLGETLPVNTIIVWVNIFGLKVVIAYKCI